MKKKKIFTSVKKTKPYFKEIKSQYVINIKKNEVTNELGPNNLHWKETEEYAHEKESKAFTKDESAKQNSKAGQEN